jgi:Fe-Mn family superoxide dismutase
LLLEGSVLKTQSLEDIMTKSYNSRKASVLFNNVAQHRNHIKFWKWMKQSGGGSIPGNLEKNNRRVWNY